MLTRAHPELDPFESILKHLRAHLLLLIPQLALRRLIDFRVVSEPHDAVAPIRLDQAVSARKKFLLIFKLLELIKLLPNFAHVFAHLLRSSQVNLCGKQGGARTFQVFETMFCFFVVNFALAVKNVFVFREPSFVLHRRQRLKVAGPVFEVHS